MIESEYLEKRLEDQISGYPAKSSSCQSRYKVLRIIEIVLAAFMPFLSGLGEKDPHGAWIIGSLGVAITIAAAVGSIFKYHENWIQYRATSEAPRHEKYLYLARVAPYDGANAFQVAVQRIEGLISNENSP